MRLHPWLVLALLAAHPQAAWPQEAPGAGAPADAPPWHVSYIDGQATITRDGLTEELAESQPLLEGDRLRTRPGRLELRAADGTLLMLDRDTTVDVVGPTAVRLVGGRARLVADVEGAERAGWQLLSPVASVLVDEPGEFDVALDAGSSDPRLVVSVLRGRARVESLRGGLDASAGRRVVARDLDLPRLLDDAFDWRDPFSMWVAGRLESWTPTTNARYLPEPLDGYSSTLDQYGSWESYREAGVASYVWFPRVDVGWSPYTTGRWARVGRYGWTWIGYDPWAWPTHHYGRWGYTSYGRWYWIPGPIWGPSWVEWAIGPGYVGWCPLGWDNRPVFSFSLFMGHGGDWGRGYSRYGYNSWTFLNSDRFHRGDRVRQYAIDLGTLRDRDRRAFVTQRTPPPSRRAGFAIPRGSAPPRTDLRDDRPDGLSGLATPARRIDRNDAGTRSGTGPARTPGVGRDDSAVRRSPSLSRDPQGASAPPTNRGFQPRGGAGLAVPRYPSTSPDGTGRFAPQVPRGGEGGYGAQDAVRQRTPPEVRSRTPYPSSSPSGEPSRGSGAYRVAPRGDLGSSDRGGAPQAPSRAPRLNVPSGRSTPQGSPRAPQMSAPGGGSASSPRVAQPRGGSSPRGGSAPRGGGSRGAAPRSPRSRP